MVPTVGEATKPECSLQGPTPKRVSRIFIFILSASCFFLSHSFFGVVVFFLFFSCFFFTLLFSISHTSKYTRM
ncbi:uncharacterized protein BO95DRAFT_71080 [Aspergillus brunneoviolaceus CBS 621.78]|uniref:Uncharacterized protein n=1 Tax=Aspergillus brunneoviolaceus CBS 621.78 TaxID=1450534 RepID=A0ACD1GFA1_9EURO|nr:hypothetical protein BO95DRAFT_71080 [Aspergillus brunneoviolaceus CBS 621.78]RAH47853.1 hypothetical protein BO95DRAFT_71080 [Aspergillus brunneoviolaceus CBS 621.78]